MLYHISRGELVYVVRKKTGDASQDMGPISSGVLYLFVIHRSGTSADLPLEKNYLFQCLYICFTHALIITFNWTL